MEFLFSNGEESELVSITKLVLQILFYMYKKWYEYVKIEIKA
jgi:hypothetical protein